MQSTEEMIINVQEIEPRFRHQTIFESFSQLLDGESLIIHNNHDPLPVYHQLLDMWGEIFTWEYLQQGPQWWDIRVTKMLDMATENHGEQEAILINVPAIEPRLKHATIFQVFDELQPGESLIIHNDHDPKPVYFQLLSERGDIFTWEYLEQGPENWDILVTKNMDLTTSSTSENSSNENSNKEKIVDVPSLEPRLKHPTIFQTFDELQPGESFIIHNDHDPKPVYYQLLGERGDVFTWEYLLQGPDFWDIRVTRRGEEEQETIGQIAAKDLRKAEVFKKFGIDFCCGGKKTVREVCAEKGIDATIVEKELQQPISTVTNYILERKNLVNLFVLVDSRHSPQKIDLEFMEWCGESGIPFSIVFTKADKLKPGAAKTNVEAYHQKLLEFWEELPPSYITSAEKKEGGEAILKFIEKTNAYLVKNKVKFDH
jgi:uncharacterized protein (DUF2249 family)